MRASKKSKVQVFDAPQVVNCFKVESGACAFLVRRYTCWINVHYACGSFCVCEEVHILERHAHVLVSFIGF